jgi:hypothetical protein
MVCKMRLSEDGEACQAPPLCAISFRQTDETFAPLREWPTGYAAGARSMDMPSLVPRLAMVTVAFGTAVPVWSVSGCEEGQRLSV